MIELTFYTTDGCHLCEEAKCLLLTLLEQYPNRYQIEIVDIAQSDELIEQYETRIPVVKHPVKGTDLGWPFDLTMLKAFVECE